MRRRPAPGTLLVVLSPILVENLARKAAAHKKRIVQPVKSKTFERFYIGEVAKFLGRSPKMVLEYARKNYLALYALPEAKDPLWFVTKRGLAHLIVHFRLMEGRQMSAYAETIASWTAPPKPKKPRKKPTKAQIRRWYRQQQRMHSTKLFTWLPDHEFCDRAGAFYGVYPPDDT